MEKHKLRPFALAGGQTFIICGICKKKLEIFVTGSLS